MGWKVNRFFFGADEFVSRGGTWPSGQRGALYASIPKITCPNPSGGSELTFRYDLLLTARGGST
jgi:hypothetical protein